MYIYNINIICIYILYIIDRCIYIYIYIIICYIYIICVFSVVVLSLGSPYWVLPLCPAPSRSRSACRRSWTSRWAVRGRSAWRTAAGCRTWTASSTRVWGSGRSARSWSPTPPWPTAGTADADRTRVYEHQLSLSAAASGATPSAGGLGFWSTCGRSTTTPSTGTGRTCSTQVTHTGPAPLRRPTGTGAPEHNASPLSRPLQIGSWTPAAAGSPLPASCRSGRGLGSASASRWPGWSSSSSCPRCCSAWASRCRAGLPRPTCRGGWAWSCSRCLTRSWSLRGRGGRAEQSERGRGK